MKQNRFIKPQPKTYFIEIVLVTGIFISSITYVGRFCWDSLANFHWLELSRTCTVVLTIAVLLFLALTSFFIKIIKAYLTK